jgi:hypothetical protein
MDESFLASQVGSAEHVYIPYGHSMSKLLLNLLIITESAGFLVVVAFVWLNKLLDIPHAFWNEPANPVRVRECVMESVLIILVWLIVLFATRILVNRIGELESYVVMCAWCRKIRIDGRWISIEDFLDKKIKIQTSHGICEVCHEKMVAKTASRPLPQK